MRTGIALLRIRAGYESAKDAALALKVTHTYLKNVERGAAEPSFKLVKRMADAYRVSEAKVLLEIKSVRLSYHGRMLSA